MPGDKLSVIIKGESRIRLLDIESNGDYLEGVIEPIENTYDETEENLDKISKCKELALKNIDLSPHISQEISFHVRFSENPSDLADIIALHGDFLRYCNKRFSQSWTLWSALTRSSPCLSKSFMCLNQQQDSVFRQRRDGQRLRENTS